MKPIKLDKSEKKIEDDLLKGVYRPVGPAEFRRVALALERRKKDAILHIRINRMDLESLKSKARGLGVPYQTFVSELLHRYAA